MSSVLIKGMEMPQNCKECALYIEGACYAKGYRDYRSIMDQSNPDDCPLVELPPHGRLIDVDVLKQSAHLDGQLKTYIDTWIDSHATVIEAEGSET